MGRLQGVRKQFEFGNSLEMVVTADVYLPPEEELTVQEVNLSGPALRAGAFHYGKYCELQNNVRIGQDFFFAVEGNVLADACFH